jgi:GTP-binding protein
VKGPAVTGSPRFLLFDPTGESWQAVTLPQVAFAGRSNVGKSSLLNALVRHSRLARTGKTPGRTRGIAFFEVEGRFAFADLPGYGYARVSRQEREAWKTLVETYLASCGRLRKVYLLVDLRRGPEEEEKMLAEYLIANGVPYRFVATKADQVKPRDVARQVLRFSGEEWLERGGPPLVVSARTRTGVERLWGDIRVAFSA